MNGLLCSALLHLWGTQVTVQKDPVALVGPESRAEGGGVCKPTDMS